jgi:hypothetical protein
MHSSQSSPLPIKKLSSLSQLALKFLDENVVRPFLTRLDPDHPIGIHWNLVHLKWPKVC